MTDAALTSLQEQPASPGPYEVRICKGMPADCCDYGVISLTTGKEVCRVWTEADARMIASALQPSPAPVVSSHEDRIAMAERFLSTYSSDGDEAKLLDYSVYPVVRRLAALLLEAQEKVALQPSPAREEAETIVKRRAQSRKKSVAMRELPRDLPLILRTEAGNQRKPPIDYAVAEDGIRMIVRPEPDVAMAELLEEAAAAIDAALARATAAEARVKELQDRLADASDVAHRAEARLMAMTGPDARERLMHAIEGECDGLAIDDKQARAILDYVLGRQA